MKKLRQRLVDLRPYDIEQLVVGLPLEEISVLVRTEGDLRQRVQELFPHYAIWPYTPPTQNTRPEADITTQDAINLTEMAQQLEGNFVSRQANDQHTEATANRDCPIPAQVQQGGAVVVIDELTAATKSGHANTPPAHSSIIVAIDWISAYHHCLYTRDNGIACTGN